MQYFKYYQFNMYMNNTKQPH